MQQIYLIRQFTMNRLLILLLLAGVALAHIYSSPPRVTYNYDGYPNYYSLYLQLETGIGDSDYLRLIWPESLHVTNKHQVKVNLISFSNSLQVATSTCVDESVVGTTTYHVTLGYAMQAKTWYQLQVYPSRNPVTAPPTNLLVQLLAVSDYNTNNIVYDSNMAFAYLDILAPLATPGTMAPICNSTSSQVNIPSAIYSFDIYLTPSVSSSTGGNFTIQIYYTAGAPMDTGTSIIDFSFMGLCQSAATNSGSAAVLLFCSISNDLTTITFSMNSVTAGQAIRISTSISNPPYKSVRGVKAYWTEFISGKVMENGLVSNALSVTSIPIQTVSPRILLFWGIESSYTDGTLTTPLPLFSAGSGSPNVLPYNSFNIGFSFSQSSPIAGRYVVYVTLGAAGVAEGTIAHNLPAYSGTSVYCYYDTTNVYIVCKNVGAFININYRYFVSGKAFFTFGTASPIAAFGTISITPIVYDTSGAQILSPSLYTDLTGVSTSVQASQEFLDLGGYHDTTTRSIGNSRVVSYYDDLTLSSTANAMSGFLKGSNSSVGVIPDLGTSQQLLFLLNTPTASVSSGVNTYYNIQLMYNSYVIGFESGAETRGLDFVGYLSGSTAWSISGSPCFYHTVVCEKYNNDTPTYNTKSTVAPNVNGLNWYGMYNFQCGTTYSPTPSPSCTSNCATECTMFTGYGIGDQGASTMAMRQVVLPNGYHSPLYADKNLLDFLFIFKHGPTVISYCLINAFTLTGARLQNIKASYVNYYDSTTGPYNKGVRVPMMVRIGGGVLPEESRGATAIGIFFDDNVDAQTFYSTPGDSWAVGCSTGSCSYFPNKGVSNSRTDNWLLNRQVIVLNLPPIQNQFNILVPVTPDATRRSPPKYLTLAFFTQNYTLNTASGLLNPLAVYRLFGPVVTASVLSALGAINGLARRSSNSPDMELSADGYAEAGSFGINLNTTNMYSSPTNNTFTYGNSDSTNTFGTYFGGGYTITCFYYNIFASATLSWATPPANTATTCTIFGYIYNELQSAGSNLYKTGRWIYTAFCPIDSAFAINSPVANIDFINPQYPLFFTNGFILRSVLAIAYSSQQGFFRAYRKETNSITTLVRNCTTAKLQPYNPTSTGKQRATFTLTLPAITMSANGYDGYSSFRVQITIPSSTVSGASLSMGNICETSNSLLSCTVTSTSTAPFQMRFNYVSTGTATITYLEIGIYATVGNNFGTASDYIVNVKLPQYISGISTYVPFGDTNYASSSTYCTCQSSFTVGITPYGAVAALSSLTFASAQKGLRSSLSFIFGASSYRDAFFSTSTYLFDFGFLSTPCSNPYYTRSNFRCMILQGTSASSLALSSGWKSLSLSSFSSVTLTPKAEISNPSSIVYKMQCYGGGIPTGGSTSDITAKWQDPAGSNVQIAPIVAYSSLTLAADAPTTATFTFDNKRFNTAGMKALYSFRITSPVDLTSASRFYLDFHMKLSSYLDHQGVIQCYIRTATPIIDSDAKYTYCSFTTWWQLMVWNNLNSLTAGTALYLDIYNVDLPKNADVGGNQKIMLTVDVDSDYTNGVASTVELTDTSPVATTPTDFAILTTQVTSNYILSSQTLTVTLDMGSTAVFSSGASLYFLFPASYAQWTTRSQTMPVVAPADATAPYCLFVQTGMATNLATACTFISQRILKISVSAITTQLFTLTLKNINTPAAVPEGKFNQYRFKLFLAGASEATVSMFSFTDYSQHLTLSTNPSLISLSWKYYSLAVADSKVALSALDGQVITVQQGYFGRVVELRQSIYPSNFKATLQLTVSNYPTSFVSLTPLTVTLGTPTAYFRLAAKDTSTSPGLYILQFAKTGDTFNSYTNIPPLTLVVENTKCVLSTDASTYTIPIGGMTLPVRIDAINCIPTDSVTFSVVFTGTGNTQFSVNNDLSTLSLTSLSPDGKLYFILKHTVPSTGSLVAGNSVTATITVGGPNSAYYSVIASFTLTLVDATTFQNFPTGTALSSPTLATNTATFQLQCSQASRIYWGIGVYPSILNNQQVDFEARIISSGKGLLTNFTEQNDYYGRVYGLRQGTTMQVISKTLYNLQSNVNYIFKYFCVNQLGHVSDSQSINFTTLNYGAYLMKVEITFRGPITYQQYQNLACSLAENFIIPYSRIMTEAMSYCGNTPYVFYSSSSSIILNEADSNGWYIYGFYIEPDYSLPSDPTNTNIRNQLSLSTQATTIITTTTDYITLPVLVQMQTTDIQIYTVPILSLSSPLSGLTSVVITASITNMNGFIVMGVMPGAFNTATMTVPSAANIKNGVFSASINLTAVKMIHTTQNYNTTFQFNSLSADTLYTFFYFCTVQDPSITALASTVGTFSAQTLQMLIIDINWAPAVPLHLLALLVLAFLAL